MSTSQTTSKVVLYGYIPFILWDIIVFIKMLQKLYINHNKQSRKLSILQQILHHSCFIAIILTSLFDMLHGLGAITTNTALIGASTPNWVKNIGVIGDVFYYINSMLLYIILVSRLFATFQDTKYQITAHWFYLILFQIIIQILLMSLYTIDYAIYYDTTTEWNKILEYSALAITINDSILILILFTLFIIKLRELIATKLKEDIFEWNPRVNDQYYDKNAINESLVDQKHINLLNIVTKQTVIGVFITLINQSYAMCVFIEVPLNSMYSAETLAMNAYLIRAIESSLVCFLLYIGLAINSNEYLNVCKFCHKQCYHLCVKLLRKNIQQTVNNNSILQTK